MLSYNDLPTHLKRCFAYCAIYPKDYLFCKEQVIHLWIANGLVQQLHSANQYFLELISRSLFERVRESSEWNPREFLMHDLVNDLAQITASNLCIRLEENQGYHMLEQSRHMSYSIARGDFEKLKPLYKLEKLRTLLPINIQHNYSTFPLSKRVLHNILPRLRSLRALSLSHYQIKELPDDLFIKLKLLRFLNLSLTAIKRLPDSICALYNLETLLLSDCYCLEEIPLQMEKLINLRHLDIRNNYLLKMPLHLSKLKNLHVLVGAKVHLGGHGGLKMEDLGELHNLYGSLSILELQNVVDRRKAMKANMREKNHVEKLFFGWSRSIADNSQTERDILDELQPNTNIKELRITGYRGTKFPNWLADISFLKLVRVSLSNCNDCDSLPALGQLPSLKFLAIMEMHRITEVTEEFYGSSSHKKPFNSLEKLHFEKMPEWKQWHVLGKGEFPTLHDLWIEDCPKLIGKLPENLCSLRGLIISKCPELNFETPIPLSNVKGFQVIGSTEVGVLSDPAQLFWHQLQGMKQIDVLEITDRNSSLLNNIPLDNLKIIRIHRNRKLNLEKAASEMVSSRHCSLFLETLDLDKCDSIDDISLELVPRASCLRVSRCQRLTRLLITNVTEDLSIQECKNLETLSMACGTQTTLLCKLSIYDCQKLKWLPERMQELLPSLKELELYSLKIESFPEGGLPLNLQVLRIMNCRKLVNGLKEWRLQRLSCLRELEISHNGSDVADENWELPCSIRRLSIHNLKALSSQVLESLTSLEYLCASYLPQIQSLLEEGFPSSIFELELKHHHDIHSIPTEGLRYLTSLQRLLIWDFPNLQSLPVSAMPSSLSELTIWECCNLQSIPESALPSSLSKLTIRLCSKLQFLMLPSTLSVLTIENCLNLQFLSVKGMPSSLSTLSISNCPLLKPLLEFGKGEYWPNIAQVSTIRVDQEYL